MATEPRKSREGRERAVSEEYEKQVHAVLGEVRVMLAKCSYAYRDSDLVQIRTAVTKLVERLRKSEASVERLKEKLRKAESTLDLAREIT